MIPPGLVRVTEREEIETAAEEEDSGSVVEEVATAASGSLDGLDLGVEAFSNGVGDL